MAAPTNPAPLPALQRVLDQLEAFKRKFYLSLLVRGGLVAVGLLLTLFVVFNLLEYFLYLPTWVRGGLLFGFLGLTVYAFVRWIWQPLAALTNLRRLLSDEQAASRVGELFPEVQDKLLNALQLQGQARENALIAASLEQRAGQLAGFEFTKGIDLKTQTRPLWKYVAVPAGIIALLLLIYPALFVQGTERILHYNRAYAPPAPFRFVVENKQLQAFKGEDFALEVAVEGEALPNEINVRYEGRERRLTKQPNGRYRYEFKQLQKNVAFQLAAAGFTSDEYDLRVQSRPDLRDFSVRVSYPAYLGRAAETLRNTGNLTVPEGSTVQWQFATEATDALQLVFQNPDETVTAAAAAGNQFTATRRVLRSQPYVVRLRNPISLNRDPITYQLTALPDQVPDITLETFADTTARQFLALGGTVRDDYGLSRLQLHYRVAGRNPNAPYQTHALPLQSGTAQAYAYQWDVRGLNLKPGDRLEYFVQVWDNDGVHGPKSARTRNAEFRLPSRTAQRQQLAQQSAAMQNQLSRAGQQSKELEREMAKGQDKLKTKRELSFQDRKQLQNMLQEKQQMDQQLADMKRAFEQMMQQQNELDPKSQELAEKAQELQKLMETLLDPETKKLYEELQKLLENQQDHNQLDMQQLLQKLENKENTLQKELERALEMFKQLQFEQKQEAALDKLQKLADEQKKLAEQTQQNDKSNPENQKDSQQQKADNQKLQQQQQANKEQFEEIKQDLKDLKKMDEQLDGENGADEMKPEQQQVDEQLQEGEQQLSKNQNQKASQAQQQAAQKMQQMAQKMQQQMDQEQQDQQQQNIDGLRDILENLLKLSFDEEELMKQFRQVDQSDPRFVQLGQQQRKLKDDARVVQDSLYSLAKKVFQLQSFVTREVGEMNGRMDESMNFIQQRNVSRATASQQQAMTSMNNLALMLNDALQQMQEQQRQSQQNQQQGGGKPGRKKKKGSAAGEGQMGRMQQQLNQQIQQLQQSGKSGRAMSEELAKLAGQQQMLRDALQKLEKMQPGGKQGKGEAGGGGTGDLKKMMEQTETDLVNKRLTEQTIMRQRQILTRLLEAEKSAQERDQEERREAQTAQNRPPVFPPAFEKYKQQKTRQTELLRTVPPALTPYYQREVGEYFQKMK